jgi:hydroxymethylglutaryl-CoA reductase
VFGGGTTLPAKFPDTLATALEVMVAAGAVALMVRGSGPTRSAARSVRVTIAAAVVAGALALVGVLAQAGTIGSSPAGHGSGVTGPSAPGGGGGSSGGGSYGGGSSGGGSYGY